MTYCEYVKVLNSETDTIYIKLYVIIISLLEIENICVIISKKAFIRLLKSYVSSNQKLSRKLKPSDDNIHREKLFGMLYLTIYFKGIGIGEVVRFVNNCNISSAVRPRTRIN